MQPFETQERFSTKSQLFNSLKMYLNNKKRLQPIIGLGSIIECVSAQTHNREPLYLCEVCVCRISKADIRSHITGSLHRYSYIRAWHPHLLSEWKVNCDLSKLAWPLMEKAKRLEIKEGPGDVQLLEVEDAVYQKMATGSESDAVTLINILREGQAGPQSHSETMFQKQRMVFLSPAEAPSLTQSTAWTAPAVHSGGWLNNKSATLLDNNQTSPEPSVPYENSSSFLDGYSGNEPLIGLSHVVECRSEDGQTYCFLCHCCRIRSNTEDVIDHLTSSSHLLNYLTESHPEQVEVMTADINDNYELLQTLAEKVEQEEGRGEPKVINSPESLCVLLIGRSYHWCVKMLYNGGTHINIGNRNTAVKGPNVSKTLNEGRPGKCAAVLPKTKERKRKIKNTVFKVSLPLSKGPLLLKRTSFSVDSLPVSPGRVSPADSDPIPSPLSQSEGYKLTHDSGPLAVKHAEQTSVFRTSQHQPAPCSGDAYRGQYMTPFTCYQENYNRQYHSQGGNSERFLPVAPSLTATYDWSSYYSAWRPEEGYTQWWHSLTPQTQFSNRFEEWRQDRQEDTSHYASRAQSTYS